MYTHFFFGVYYYKENYVVSVCPPPLQNYINRYTYSVWCIGPSVRHVNIVHSSLSLSIGNIIVLTTNTSFLSARAHGIRPFAVWPWASQFIVIDVTRNTLINSHHTRTKTLAFLSGRRRMLEADCGGAVKTVTISQFMATNTVCLPLSLWLLLSQLR